MDNLLAITWTFDKVLFSFGERGIRWYGLLFAIAFMAGYYIMRSIFRKEKVSETLLDKLLIYVMIATVIGARLGHVFFYQWDYYSQNPAKIFKIWEGGLASHGAAIAIIIAMYIFSKKVSKRSMLWILDRVVITVALAGCLIRTGNLVNSEIIGQPSDASYAFVFAADTRDYIVDEYGEDGRDYIKDVWFINTGDIKEVNGFKHPVYSLQLTFFETQTDATLNAKVVKQDILTRLNTIPKDSKHFIWPAKSKVLVNPDDKQVVTATLLGIPRHPAQLYEAFAYLLVFLLLFYLYWRTSAGQRQGLLFGIFLVLVFTARFFIEFLKENQVEFEEELSLNMGQNLSIPLVIIGLIFIVIAMRKKPELIDEK